MDTMEKVKAWKRKTINGFELASLFGTDSDEQLSPLVSELVAEGVLSPIRSSGTNGNRVYPVFLKYRICLKKDDTDVLDEISLLHPQMLQSGYLQSNPDTYRKHRAALLKLNEYLFSEHSTVPVSRKERSFAVFDEEKTLQDSTLCRLLDAMELDGESLCYYDTPEYCFHDYIPVRKRCMTLLICENKDIWFNIRRRMYEDGCREIFGVEVDGVVYGCGNRVSEQGALQAYTDFLGCETVHYLYWGDIDRAGLAIFQSAARNNPCLQLSLFTQAYCEMVHLAQGRSIPDSEDHRRYAETDWVCLQTIPESEREQIYAYLRENKRLPQEIVSYEHLLTDMR